MIPQTSAWLHDVDAGEPSGSRRRLLCNELEMCELVLPAQANHYGTLFGPNALALLRGEFEMLTVDEAGRPCAVKPLEKLVEPSFSAP